MTWQLYWKLHLPTRAEVESVAEIKPMVWKLRSGAEATWFDEPCKNLDPKLHLYTERIK